MYDYIELRLLILRKYKSLANFCNEFGINPQALSHTMSAGNAMGAKSIETIAKALGIEEQDYGYYFFAKKQ